MWRSLWLNHFFHYDYFQHSDQIFDTFSMRNIKWYEKKKLHCWVFIYTTFLFNILKVIMFLYARNYSNEGVMSCCYYFLFSDNLHQACTSKNITSLLAKALVFVFSQSSIAFIVKLPVTLIKNKFVVARTESYCYRKFIIYIS